MKEDTVGVVLCVMLLCAVLYLLLENRTIMAQERRGCLAARDSCYNTVRYTEIIGSHLLEKMEEERQDWAEFLEELHAKGAFRKWEREQYKRKTGKKMW